MNLRYPKISGIEPEQQIKEIRAFLHQLVDIINLQSSAPATRTVSNTPTAPTTTPQGTFNSIKSLIIKSADIVDAYYEEYRTRFDGHYVGVSEFGTYKERTSLEIQANSSSINQQYNEIQQIISDLGQVNSMLAETSAYIKTGKLEENVYGVEVGRRTSENGTEVYNKYGRFTSNGLTFYDENSQAAAFITDRRLRCPNVVIENTLSMGGFLQEVNNSGEVIERWVQ